MFEIDRQTHRLTLTHGLTHAPKAMGSLAFRFDCEAVSHDSAPTNIQRRCASFLNVLPSKYVCMRAHAHVRTRTCKGPETDSRDSQTHGAHGSTTSSPRRPRWPVLRPAPEARRTSQGPPRRVLWPIGTSGRNLAGDASGNSRHPRHSLFSLSERPTE